MKKIYGMFLILMLSAGLTASAFAGDAGALPENVINGPEILPAGNSSLVVSAPDGEDSGQIEITLCGMTLKADIIHEDTQKELHLCLDRTTLEGMIRESGGEQEDASAAPEGSQEYSPDAAEKVRPRVHVTMQNGAVWNVTGECRISSLTIGDGCRVSGDIYLDGVKADPAGTALEGETVKEDPAGVTFEGDIVVRPRSIGGVVSQRPPRGQESPAILPELVTSQEETTTAWEEPTTAWEEPTTAWAEPATAWEEPTQAQTGQLPAYTVEDAQAYIGHEHDWVFQYELLTTCTTDNCLVYQCSICGLTYTELIGEPAYGHNMAPEPVEVFPATCEEPGSAVYQCVNCGMVEIETIPALGHWWHPEEIVYPTCTEDGYDMYKCARCGKIEVDTASAKGHDYICYPTPGDEAAHHTFECTKCGDTYQDIHETYGGDACYYCGYPLPLD